MAPERDQAALVLTSAGFAEWLAEVDASPALTTYQSGWLMFLGLRPDLTLRAHERIIKGAQGLWTDGDSLQVTGKAMLWRCTNDVPAGMATPGGAVRRFVPREGRVTGLVDIHDIGVGQQGNMTVPGPIFVNTLFSCLATVSEAANFRPLWKPPFISDVRPEDRCHLNGMAMQHGRPTYVTAISRSDVWDGWRDRRRDGGVVIDVASGEVVANGLSMPHSPRLRDCVLRLLNSGTEELGSA